MATRWIKRDQCIVCGSSALNEIRTENNHPIGRQPADQYLNSTSVLVECSNCKLAFVQTLPDSSEFYSCIYADDGRDVSEDFKLSGKELIFNQMLSCLNRYKKSGTLLDIGTGTGVWLKYASKAFSCTGLEIGGRSSEYGQSQGLNILNRSDFGQTLESESYDVVTMIDVLEHLPDPLAVLKNCYRIVKRDGLILIKVPNYKAQAFKQDLLKKLHLSQEGIMQNFIHINHFTPESLNFALEYAQFDLLEVQAMKPEIWNWKNLGTGSQTLRRLTRNLAVVGASAIINNKHVWGKRGGLNFCAIAKKEGNAE